MHTLLHATVTAGESNSMLLIGARGGGKTALVNSVLKDLSKTSADDFHVVTLNGFVHTDDRIALRDIWHQLGREMESDESDIQGPGKSYADTLAMLLALLSHPDELMEQGKQSTGDNKMSRSVIFIMDEFDLFCIAPSADSTVQFARYRTVPKGANRGSGTIDQNRCHGCAGEESQEPIQPSIRPH